MVKVLDQWFRPSFSVVGTFNASNESYTIFVWNWVNQHIWTCNHRRNKLIMKKKKIPYITLHATIVVILFNEGIWKHWSNLLQASFVTIQFDQFKQFNSVEWKNIKWVGRMKKQNIISVIYNSKHGISFKKYHN